MDQTQLVHLRLQQQLAQSLGLEPAFVLLAEHLLLHLGLLLGPLEGSRCLFSCQYRARALFAEKQHTSNMSTTVLTWNRLCLWRNVVEQEYNEEQDSSCLQVS